MIKERSMLSEQPKKRGVPTFQLVDVFVTFPPLRMEGNVSAVNKDFKYMLPNCYEPSDHKAIVAWIVHFKLFFIFCELIIHF